MTGLWEKNLNMKFVFLLVHFALIIRMLKDPLDQLSWQKHRNCTQEKNPLWNLTCFQSLHTFWIKFVVFEYYLQKSIQDFTVAN
jgi:hypothetical protein